MTKYKGLPDIDNDTPEVLESGPEVDILDEVGAGTRYVDETSNDAIDMGSLTTVNTEIYSDSVIDNRSTDFSGSLSDGVAKGYRVAKADETVNARVVRLRAEIEELSILKPSEASELRDLLKEKSAYIQDSYGSVNLYSDLGTGKVSRAPGRLQSAISPDLIQRYADLELRVTNLENVIGFYNKGDRQGAQNNIPLNIRLEDMRRRVALLTASPDGLDRAVAKLQDLAQIVERIRSAGPLAIQQAKTNENEKINELFCLIGSVTKMNETLPKVVSRLNSLRAIHADAQATTALVQNAQEALNIVQQEIKSWREAVESMENRLVETDKTISRNKEEMEKNFSTNHI